MMLQGRLSKKIVLIFMLISGTFSLLTTSFSLYQDYKNRVTALEDKVKNMVEDYELPLGVAIHKSQTLIVTLILENFGSVSDAYIAQVKDKDGRNIMTMPNLNNEFGISNISMTDYFRYSKQIDFGHTKYKTNDELIVIEGIVGSVEVIVSTKFIKSEVLSTLKTTLLTNFLKAILVTFIFLIVIEKTLLARLKKISLWLEDFSHNQNIELLKPRETARSDEVDDIIVVINQMSTKILNNQKDLEGIVNDRTRELIIKNQELENTQKELHSLIHSKSMALNHIEEALSTSLWETDVFGNITHISDGLKQNIHLPETEKIIVRISDFITLTGVAEDKQTDKIFRQIFEYREHFNINDAEISDKHGNRISVRVDGRPKLMDGTFVGFSGTITDVSSEKKLQKLAYSDSLTGLANRLALDQYFDKIQHRANRLNFTNGIMLLDLDHFKSINDKYGHSVGDEVLKAVSVSLLSCIRDEDLVARIGGEEFVVVVQGASLDGMISLAERIGDAVRSLRLVALPIERKITVSIGLTTASLSEPLSEVLKRADNYLYLSKTNGRDTFTYCSK